MVTSQIVLSRLRSVDYSTRAGAGLWLKNGLRHSHERAPKQNSCAYVTGASASSGRNIIRFVGRVQTERLLASGPDAHGQTGVAKPKSRISTPERATVPVRSCKNVGKARCGNSSEQPSQT